MVISAFNNNGSNDSVHSDIKSSNKCNIFIDLIKVFIELIPVSSTLIGRKLF
jgi:hypothetical protein